jgi:hypothetical protein
VFLVAEEIGEAPDEGYAKVVMELGLAMSRHAIVVTHVTPQGAHDPDRGAKPCIRVVVDNASSQQTPEVAAWLEKNRRGVFKSLGALVDAIQRFLDAWNENSKPFVWVKSAEQILDRIERQRFTMTVH